MGNYTEYKGEKLNSISLKKKVDASGKKAQRKDVRFSICWGFFVWFVVFYLLLKAEEISLLDYKGEYGWAQSRNKVLGNFFFFFHKESKYFILLL